MAFLPVLGIALPFIWLVYHYLIYPAFVSPLSKIPKAHFTSSFSSIWLRRQRRNGSEATATLFSLHQKKGPIVLLSPNEISVASLEALRTIYTGGFNRPVWFVRDFNHFGTPSLFSMVSKQQHGERRRQLSSIYAKSYLTRSNDMRVLSEAIIFGRLFPVLDNATKRDGIVDVMNLDVAVGTDFITAYLYGLQNGTNHILDPESGREFYRVQQKFFNAGFKYPERGAAEALGMKHIQAANEELNRHPGEKPEDSPERITTAPVVFSQMHRTVPKAELERHVPGTKVSAVMASETFDHTLAGMEAVRTTLSFLHWELSKRPSLQHRLREELLTLNPPIQANAGTLPSLQALDTLPLLDAVLFETLRRYSPVEGLLYRITPPEGCTLHGYRIPGNITASVAPYFLHRNEEVFPNPEEWNPDRWIVKNKDDEERVKEMRRWFWAFGSGTKTCPGKHFVEFVMKMATAAIYTNYTTAIVEDKDMVQMDGQFSSPVADKLILKLSPVV